MKVIVSDINSRDVNSIEWLDTIKSKSIKINKQKYLKI